MANGYSEFLTPDGRAIGVLVDGNVTAVVESTTAPEPPVSLLYLWTGSTAVLAVQGEVSDVIDQMNADYPGTFVPQAETLTDGRAAVFNVPGYLYALQEVDADSCAVLFYSPNQDTLYLVGDYATLAVDLQIEAAP